MRAADGSGQPLQDLSCLGDAQVGACRRSHRGQLVALQQRAEYYALDTIVGDKEGPDLISAQSLPLILSVLNRQEHEY